MRKFDGTYSVEYTGKLGGGHGQMTIDNGVITGKDYTGATYSGQGSLGDNGLEISLHMTQSNAPGTYNVMTGQHGGALDFSFALPEDFLSRDSIKATTSLGPLLLKVRRS